MIQIYLNLGWPHPEIGDADVSAPVEQDIARLDITVDVSVIVEVLEPCTRSNIQIYRISKF